MLWGRLFLINILQNKLKSGITIISNISTPAPFLDFQEIMKIAPEVLLFHISTQQLGLSPMGRSKSLQVQVKMPRTLSTHMISNCVQGLPWLWTRFAKVFRSEAKAWAETKQRCPVKWVQRCPGTQRGIGQHLLIVPSGPREASSMAPSCQHHPWIITKDFCFIYIFLQSMWQIHLVSNMAEWSWAKGDLTVIHRLSL